MDLEPTLPLTATHAGREAKGTILGLEGRCIVPVLFAVVVSVLLLILLVTGSSGALGPRLTLALSPTAATIAYVGLLVHRRPPHYARDVRLYWRTRVPLAGLVLAPQGLAFNGLPRRGKGMARPRVAGYERNS